MRVEQDTGSRDAVAVIGMACVYPGAHSPEALWTNVLAGRREFRRFPDERLPRDAYFDPDPRTPDRCYCDQMAVVTDWEFDPAEFRVPPVTVAVTDPTHWMALWTAKRALLDAGLDLDGVDRSRVRVVMGNSLGGEFGRATYLRYRWPFLERAFRRAAAESGTAAHAEPLLEALRRHYLEPIPEVTEDSLAGTMSNTIAGRICVQFDLGGGGYSIDGACSSSLLAVANACDALSRGDVDVAIAGGVDISLDPYELIGFSKARALARDDIRPYDERASGMLPGEGCGVVVLMRAAHAQAEGRRAHALLRGWACASDGRTGITAPRVEGQVRAIQRAYARAGYGLGTVGLIEGHGTGTALGDDVELAAILAALDGEPEARCRIGSIKGQIGHCKAAAGMAGLLKAVMALERKILPPSPGCERPHRRLRGAQGRLTPAVLGEPWPAGETPRRAGVSAFGFGGSNVHVTLEEADPGGRPRAADLALLGSDQPAELLLLSAPDRAALARRVARLRAVAPRLSRAELVDVAAALADEDRGEALRVAIESPSPWHLAATLDRLALDLDSDAPIPTLAGPHDGVYAGVVAPGGAPPRLAAVFPGQAAHRVGMGGALLRRHPEARRLYDAFDAAVADLLPGGVRRWSERDPRLVDDALAAVWEAELRETAVAQPAIVAASIATLRALERVGLRPTVVLGHSLGEISALCAAGLLDAAVAVRAAAIRGRAMADLAPADPGAMLAISAPASEVEALLGPDDDIVVANRNSPRQTVVSGGSAAVESLASRCQARGTPARRLATSHAFHSPRVSAAAASLGERLPPLPSASPRCAVISTMTGSP